MKGFVEGTTHITTGDKMKDNDHRRSKTKCFYFDKGLCVYSGKRARNEIVKINKDGQVICGGSAHCKRYGDGISVKKPKDSKMYVVKILRKSGAIYVKSLNENNLVEFTDDYTSAARFKLGVALNIARKYKNASVM